MKDEEICRLTLTVIGRRVNGTLQWEPEITTTTYPSRFWAYAKRNDYERWLVLQGLAALTEFETDVVQCDTERPGESEPTPSPE